jgi:alpha-methylacyl-CoA racemase
MSILYGMKVLDFSTLLPGPYATMMLADMGAEVLRVESPSRPDLVRGSQPADEDGSAAHAFLNRSKKSIALDLKKPEAIEIVKKLVKEYDIVVEQFRPGVMDRLGLDYDSLKEVNPGIIYCSLTGFGQTGPYRNRPGHDNNYISIAGFVDYSRRAGQSPVPQGIQIADVAGGSLHSVIGILAALLHRERTGAGQFIDVSFTDAAFALNAMGGASFLACGVEPKAEQTSLNGGCFYDFYQTKDGRYFSVGSMEPQFRKLLCEAIGRPDLFPVAMSKVSEDGVIFKKEVRAIFLSKTAEEWNEVFRGIEACVEPVLSFAEACEHEQIKAREMIVEVPKPNGSAQKQIAFPIKFSSAQPVYKHIGKRLGEDTNEVLHSLGMHENEVHALRDKGVFS